MNFEKLSSGRNIMQNLKDCVCAVLDLRTFKIGSVCDEHLQQQSEYMLSLLLRVQIHHFVRVAGARTNQETYTKPQSQKSYE